MDAVENMYRVAGDDRYSDTHRQLAARAIARAGRPGIQTTPAGDVLCRSCGFQAHPASDLIDGQCPRWAAGS